MDYEKLVEGRRRNWDALKPEEIRRLEKEEEKARKRAERDEKEKKGEKPTTFERMRRRMMDEAAAQDKERYRRAVRQGGILLGAFVLLGLIVWGIEKYAEMRSRRVYAEDMQNYEVVLTTGKEVNDPADPVGALATWRSAWKEGDMNRVVELMSRRNIKNLTGGASDTGRLKTEYARLYKTGGLRKVAETAVNFQGAEIVRIPRKPWSDEQLAIFRSGYFQTVGEGGGEGVRYIVAFSFDKRAAEWRFADLREEEFFSVNWEFESSIHAKIGGAGAIRYDEKGNRLPAKPVGREP